MSDADDLTDGEAFALIEGLADAAGVAHAVGQDGSVEDALEEIQSIAADHFDDEAVEALWKER